MRKNVIAALFASLLAPQPCASQTDEIHIFIDPVLIKDLYYTNVINAIEAALSSKPFVRHEKPGTGFLLITETEKPKFREGALEFSVSFFRNGDHLGGSIETCDTNKVSDCADQLASDAKSAAAIKD
jgi:hypothetical protein